MDQKPASQLDLERRGQHGTVATMQVKYKAAPEAGLVTINVTDFDEKLHEAPKAVADEKPVDPKAKK
jgi:hypothetical protein